jgi:hypothetical protein
MNDQQFLDFLGVFHPKTAARAAHPPGPEADLQARLDAAGIRLIEIEGVMHAGVWSWLDGPELRTALAALGSAEAPILYLDGPGVEDRYKEYKGDPALEREPPPLAVIEAMYQHPDEPWKVREQMLVETGWSHQNDEPEAGSQQARTLECWIPSLGRWGSWEEWRYHTK